MNIVTSLHQVVYGDADYSNTWMDGCYYFNIYACLSLSVVLSGMQASYSTCPILLCEDTNAVRYPSHAAHIQIGLLSMACGGLYPAVLFS